MFIISHGITMGQQVIDGNKLEIFLFLFLRDVNLELVQDGKACSNKELMLIMGMHQVFIEVM
jgi:hypothetical protein